MTSLHRILCLALAAGSATPAFAAVERSFACTGQGSDCPKAVADAHGTAAGVTTAGFTLASGACDGNNAAVAGVSVDLVHGFVGDLTLELVPPSGAPVQLIARLEKSGGIAGSCSSDDLATRFSATGDTPVCSGGEIPATQAQVRASGNLVALGSEVAPGGTWQLRITDAVSGGYGVLANWNLHLACNIADLIFADSFE